jgi:hypothetical protein
MTVLIGAVVFIWGFKKYEDMLAGYENKFQNAVVVGYNQETTFSSKELDIGIYVLILDATGNKDLFDERTGTFYAVLVDKLGSIHRKLKLEECPFTKVA